MPLRIEKLFQEYNLPGSFAVASLLTLVAIFTLIAKTKLAETGLARKVSPAADPALVLALAGAPANKPTLDVTPVGVGIEAGHP